MTYVLTTKTCHAERATFAAGLVVYEPGHSETLQGWVAGENAEELSRPSPAQREHALGLDGHLAHRDDEEEDDG